MAAEAEASREARAKVIAAEGEQKASRALREASEVIGDSPAALQLRYLQVQYHKYTSENNLPNNMVLYFIHFYIYFDCRLSIRYQLRKIQQLYSHCPLI